MVVCYLDVVGIAVVPREADPPLVVDANAPLTLAIADQPFEPVAGQHSQVCELHCRVQHQELAQRGTV